jgi:hypothetical protein
VAVAVIRRMNGGCPVAPAFRASRLGPASPVDGLCSADLQVGVMQLVNVPDADLEIGATRSGHRSRWAAAGRAAASSDGRSMSGVALLPEGARYAIVRDGVPAGARVQSTMAFPARPRKRP